MNNDQPQLPGTLLFDPKRQGRSRVKVAVFSVLALHVAALTTLLLTQGCKREVPVETQLEPELPTIDTNAYYADTNLPPALQELPPYVPPAEAAAPPPTPPPTATISEYVVKSGDSFYSIGKAHNVSIKAIQDANPGVDPKRLQPGQKLVLPAPESPSAPTVGTPAVQENVYVVKSGDTLSRIATRNNTTVSALKQLNGLTTDRINVGQKLKLPPAPAPAPVPMTEPLPPAPMAPALPPSQ
jgi:LysM repeat protein